MSFSTANNHRGGTLPIVCVWTALLIAAPPSSAQEATDGTAKKPKWDTSIGLGFSLERGNTRNILGSADLNSTRKWGIYGAEIRGSYMYGESFGQTYADNYGGGLKVTRDFNDDRYYSYAKVDHHLDSVSDFSWFYTGPGLGWHAIQNDKLNLDLEGGAYYERDKKGTLTINYLALAFYEKLTYQLTETAKIWQSVSYSQQADLLGNYFVGDSIGIEFEINTYLSFSNELRHTYLNQPAVGSNKHDFAYIAGIKINF